MIRYHITIRQLVSKINKHKPSWWSRARRNATILRDNNAYVEPPSPIWGEIKTIYITLQKDKCAFCERKLTKRRKDYHVEHFRPKCGVKVWPDPIAQNDYKYDFPTGNEFNEGYYLVAYHPLNYSVTCEHCNVGLKSSYFPIEGLRKQNGNISCLMDEWPLLIYPIGNIDDDPEMLIEFEGVIPKPINTDKDTYNYHRAQVTIDFFQIQEREELRRERAEVIEKLWFVLQNENNPNIINRRQARHIIKRLTSTASQHTNCARCYVRLYRNDPNSAKKIARLATLFLAKIIR